MPKLAEGEQGFDNAAWRNDNGATFAEIAQAISEQYLDAA